LLILYFISTPIFYTFRFPFNNVFLFLTRGCGTTFNNANIILFVSKGYQGLL
ncbi:MAG: hypothetical protein ACJATA_002021, partial [Sphingobacteriales bacterium]